jgi:hypothetical protein
MVSLFLRIERESHFLRIERESQGRVRVCRHVNDVLRRREAQASVSKAASHTPSL